MKIDVIKGVTSKLIEIFISDSSSITGEGLTGVVFGDITGYYYRSGAGSEVELAALKTMTLGTWVTEGFIEIDATNMPGYYQLGLPDAALVSGANQVNFLLKGAADMAPLPIEIQLVEPFVYEGGIWINSGVANTNTVPGVDGLRRNPVSTFIAARTLADILGFKKYFITNGSALTLAATHQWWEFVGLGRAANIINFGSQDVDNSKFSNLSLAGTQGGSTFVGLDKSVLTSLVSLRPWATNCRIAGDITILTGSMLTFENCRSGMPGDATFALTFTAGVTSVQFRDYSGGIEVKNMTSDHTMSLETDGQLIVNANCNNANITVRGMMSITDLGTNTNITKDAVYNKQEVRDAMKVAPTAGAPAAGSVDAHLDSIQAKTDNLPEIKRKNVAFSNPFQFFMEDSNGDGLASLTVTGIKILDGVRTAITAAISEVAGSIGWYKMTPVAADTNADHVSYEFSATGALTSIVEFWTTV